MFRHPNQIALCIECMPLSLSWPHWPTVHGRRHNSDRVSFSLSIPSPQHRKRKIIFIKSFQSETHLFLRVDFIGYHRIRDHSIVRSHFRRRSTRTVNPASKFSDHRSLGNSKNAPPFLQSVSQCQFRVNLIITGGRCRWFLPPQCVDSRTCCVPIVKIPSRTVLVVSEGPSAPTTKSMPVLLGNANWSATVFDFIECWDMCQLQIGYSITHCWIVTVHQGKMNIFISKLVHQNVLCVVFLFCFNLFFVFLFLFREDFLFILNHSTPRTDAIVNQRSNHFLKILKPNTWSTTVVSKQLHLKAQLMGIWIMHLTSLCPSQTKFSHKG